MFEWSKMDHGSGSDNLLKIPPVIGLTILDQMGLGLSAIRTAEAPPGNGTFRTSEGYDKVSMHGNDDHCDGSSRSGQIDLTTVRLPAVRFPDPLVFPAGRP